MKDVFECTKKELLEMETFFQKENFNGIVIVPTGKKHDSGFMCMKFILLNRNKVVGVVSGWSDVVHVNGICGFGKNMKYMDCGMEPVAGWSIDCLPKSGCVRLFSRILEYECEDSEFVGSGFVFYAAEKNGDQKSD